MLTDRTAEMNRVSTVEKGYLVLCLALLAYGLLAWRGLVGDGEPWRPISFIALSGALVLLALAPFVRSRSRLAFHLLLGASFVGLGFSLVAR